MKVFFKKRERKNLSILDYGYNLPPQERLRLIKEAGLGALCFMGGLL